MPDAVARQADISLRDRDTSQVGAQRFERVFSIALDADCGWKTIFLPSRMVIPYTAVYNILRACALFPEPHKAQASALSSLPS